MATSNNAGNDRASTCVYCQCTVTVVLATTNLSELFGDDDDDDDEDEDHVMPEHEQEQGDVPYTGNFGRGKFSSPIFIDTSKCIWHMY